MAKHKHRVALFEVIHKDRRFADPSTLRPHTPGWFFRGKPAAPDSRVAMLARPGGSSRSGSAARSNPDAGALLGVPPSPVDLPSPKSETSSAPALAEQSGNDEDAMHGFVAESAPLPEAAPSDPFAPRDLPGEKEDLIFAEPPHERQTTRANAGDSWPVSAPTYFAPLDSGTRRSRSNSALTPTSLAIIAGSLVAVLSIGFAMTRSPQRVRASAPAREIAPSPGVLNVHTGAGAPRPPTNDVTGITGSANSTRHGGAQYELIHLYESQTSAEAGAAYFEAHGIHCSVEHGLGGFDPHVYELVGFATFVTTSDAAAYTKKLNSAIAAAPARIATRAFRPRLMTWE